MTQRGKPGPTAPSSPSSASPASTKPAALRRSKRVAWLVAAFALFVQAVYILDLRDDPTFATPIIDARIYHEQAWAVARGESMSEGAFWQPPLFPFLLGQAYRLAGPDLWAARALLALIAAASCGLTCALGRRFFAPRVGAAAGCALAVYGPFLFFSQELLPASLAVLLNLLAITALLAAMRAPGAWGWLVYGVISGLAVLNVANSVVLLPLGAITALLRPGRGGRTAIRMPAAVLRAALVLVGFFGAILPVTLRNHRASGEWVWVATNGGINLFVGNNANNQQTLVIRPGAEWDRLVRRPLLEGVSRHGAQSRWFVQRVLAWAREDPGGFAAGLARKAWQAVHARELPRNTDIYTARHFSWLLSGLVWRAGAFGFPWGLVAPLAVLGVAMTRGAPRAARAARSIPLVFTLLYLGTVVIVFVSSRYRLPVVPFVMMFAVAGLFRLVRTGTRRLRRGTGRAAALGLVGIALVVVNLPMRYPTDTVNFMAELHEYVALQHQKQGDIERAERGFRIALELEPTLASAAADLAESLLRRRQFPEAEGWAQRASSLAPQDPRIVRLSGDLALARGDLDEAERSYRQAAQLDPAYTPAHVALGCLYLRDGRQQPAETAFRTAIDFGDRTGLPSILLADIRVAQGRYADAVTLYRHGLTGDSAADPAVLNRVAWLLATCPVAEVRDGAAAVELAERACAIGGEDAALLGTLAAAYGEARRPADAVRAYHRAADAARRQGDSATEQHMRQRASRLEAELRSRP